MIRIDLIGPGDIDFHYQEILRISKERLEREIEKIAQALSSANVEICLLPDKGICFETARKFKEYGGKNVIALIPKQDKAFGIKHLQEYINTEVGEKPLFDQEIDTGDWFKHDLTICLFGDVVLCLGLSPGADGERAYGIYLYKLIAGFKQGVKTEITKIHPEARAGLHIPYTVILYKPFLKQGRVSSEEEAYAKKFGINLIYVNSASDLERKLKEISK